MSVQGTAMITDLMLKIIYCLNPSLKQELKCWKMVKIILDTQGTSFNTSLSERKRYDGETINTRWRRD